MNIDNIILYVLNGHLCVIGETNAPTSASQPIRSSFMLTHMASLTGIHTIYDDLSKQAVAYRQMSLLR
jgi:hypothetical protein